MVNLTIFFRAPRRGRRALGQAQAPAVLRDHLADVAQGGRSGSLAKMCSAACCRRPRYGSCAGLCRSTFSLAQPVHQRGHDVRAL